MKIADFIGVKEYAILLDMSKNEAKIDEVENSSAKSKKNHYDASSIESKWQANWEKERVYQPDLSSAKADKTSRPAFYNLMMFPYPSAEGLHVGSVYAFGGADVYGRFKRMQGADVFEPIGLDGFGIHSENHAIKINTHPVDHAKRTQENFYRQLHSFGNSFAWENKLETYDARYYKWTQWLFVQLFKSNLAYRKKSPVNYCPNCKTVLSDEQVIQKVKNEKETIGVCERCDTVVEKRDLEQWYFRITNYAEKLLANLETLDWTEKVKIAQKNWIGKSEGAKIKFPLVLDSASASLEQYSSSEVEKSIEVFTTRPDTLYGATFLVISPEHSLVASLQDKQIQSYVDQAKMKSEQERVSEGKEKTGVFSGLSAINPVTGEQIPVWIADYVLTGYGTGAIMAVPAHDTRDFEFAKKFSLPIKTVVASGDEKQDGLYTGSGSLTNSGEWDGLQVPKEIGKVLESLEKKEIGKRETTYHLRDWLISRQRYWGPPIPMIYCQKCAEQGLSWFTTDEAKEKKVSEHSVAESAGWYPVPDDQLPVELPYVKDFKPMGTGKSPLANYPEFYEVTCPHCGADARRETDVSDTFLDSAWYFFRYPSVDRDDVAMDPEVTKKWLPVNMYIGGAEHSVLHLLYARFITMMLHDLGLISFEEPFTRFYAHGLIIKDGAKMSKSKGNVINPDDYISKFGADTLRCYLAFLGPFDQGGDFRDSGIEGINRFLKRVWYLFSEAQDDKPLGKDSLHMMHKTVKKVTEDLENLRYNTALAALMEWYNFLSKQDGVSKQETEVYLQLLAPFAPHMTEELYQDLKGETGDLKANSLHVSAWPKYDETYLVRDVVTIAVQVNGKLRGSFEISADEAKDKDLVEEHARKDENVSKFLQGEIIKVIYVPGKILNFVVA